MPTGSHTLAWSLLLLTAAWGPGCGAPADPAAAPAEFTLSPRVTRPDDVVAEVNGVPLLRADLEHQMSGGQGKQAALQELIKLEVLAQEALRRGLGRDPFIRRSRSKAMATQLINKRITETFTKKSIPARTIQAAYDLNVRKYVHGELVVLNHIQVSATRRNTQDFHKRARRLAEKIRQVAMSGKLSPREFRDLADMYHKQEKMFTIRSEHLTTPRTGFTVEQFAKAAFALKEPGQISPIVATRFGYHMIYRIKRYPAVNRPLSEVEDEVRGRVFESARKQYFQAWIGQLEKKHLATVHPERLRKLSAPRRKQRQ